MRLIGKRERTGGSPRRKTLPLVTDAQVAASLARGPGRRRKNATGCSGYPRNEEAIGVGAIRLGMAKAQPPSMRILKYPQTARCESCAAGWWRFMELHP